MQRRRVVWGQEGEMGTERGNRRRCNTAPPLLP
ncbi:MAG: hypothetical protein RLZZ399_2306 [Verrucomicrobiota bacterium]|jgi:hypothetical protein